MEQIKGQANIDDFLGDLFKSTPKKKNTATSPITKATRRESNKKTEKQPLRQMVLATLADKELTAREIAAEMYNKGLLPYPARGVIQPRITELVKDGAIEATGVKFDQVTERKVAVYKVVNHV